MSLGEQTRQDLGAGGERAGDERAPARLRAAALLYAGLALAHVLAGAFPDARTWGVQQLAFLPRIALVLTAIALAFAAPRPLASRIGRGALWIERVLFRAPGLVIVCVLAGYAFYALRLKIQFLGDGLIWQNKLGQGIPFTHFDALSTAIVGQIATAIDPHRPQLAAGVPSIAFGMVYIAATWFVCRALWSEPEARSLGWLLAIFNPVLLLFFGYVESYPLLVSMQALFTLSLIGAARGRWPIIVPAIAAGIAIAMHLLAAAWLPALASLAWIDRRRIASGTSARGRAGRAVRSFGLVVAGIVVGFGLIRIVGASPTEMLRDLVAPEALGGSSLGWFFSWGHGIDVLNEYALLLGPALVLLAAALPNRSMLRALAPDGVWLPILWLLPGPVLASWIIVPRIGGARDWDLFTPVVLPAVLVGVEAWNRLRTSQREDGATRRVLAGWAVALAAVATSTWLAVNLDPVRSARRLEVVQEEAGPFNPRARGEANEILGLFYRHRDPDAAHNAWLRATQASPANPRYFRGLAQSEQQLGRIQQARAAWQRVLDLSPGNIEALRALEQLQLGGDRR